MIVAANYFTKGMLPAFKRKTEVVARECHRDYLVTAKLWAAESGVWDDGSGGELRKTSPRVAFRWFHDVLFL